MRVLITGGTGFLGRAVCRAFRARGVECVAAGRQHGDLTTPDGTLRAFSCEPDVVVHCAALCGGIGANRARPHDFAAANLLMAVNVVEQCVECKAKLVAIGTVCSYPRNCPVPFQESDLWNGYPEATNAPYGNAKRMLLDLVQAAHRQHGLRAAFLIPTNLYGPTDNFDPGSSHVIPAMIRKFCEPGPVRLWGTGRASREFLQVDDAAEGIVRAAERINVPAPINLGGGEEVTIKTLAGIVSRACGYRGTVEWDASQPDGQPRRAVSATRARAMLDWEPQVTLEDGIRQTVAWWRSQC